MYSTNFKNFYILIKFKKTEILEHTHISVVVNKNGSFGRVGEYYTVVQYF